MKGCTVVYCSILLYTSGRELDTFFCGGESFTNCVRCLKKRARGYGSRYLVPRFSFFLEKTTFSNYVCVLWKSPIYK